MTINFQHLSNYLILYRLLLENIYEDFFKSFDPFFPPTALDRRGEIIKPGFEHTYYTARDVDDTSKWSQAEILALPNTDVEKSHHQFAFYAENDIPAAQNQLIK